MKKFLITLALIASMPAITMQAQNRFGLKAGVSYQHVSNMGYGFIADKEAGFSVGPTMEFPFSNRNLGIELSALYNYGRLDINGTSTNYSTLSFPVSLKWYFVKSKGTKGFVDAGPQVDFLLSGDDEQNLEYRSMAASLNLGGGVRFKNDIQLGLHYDVPVYSHIAVYRPGENHKDVSVSSLQLSVAYFF